MHRRTLLSLGSSGPGWRLRGRAGSAAGTKRTSEWPALVRPALRAPGAPPHREFARSNTYLDVARVRKAGRVPGTMSLHSRRVE